MAMSKSVILGAIAILVVSGCAGSTHQVVPMPDQAKRIEDPDKARIYVMHLTSSVIIGVPDKVFDGETLIGSAGAYSFLCWEREPGAAKIISKKAGVNTYELPLEVEKGRVYYIQQQDRRSPVCTRLKLLKDEYGNRKLAECIRR